MLGRGEEIHHHSKNAKEMSLSQGCLYSMPLRLYANGRSTTSPQSSCACPYCTKPSFAGTLGLLERSGYAGFYKFPVDYFLRFRVWAFRV